MEISLKVNGKPVKVQAEPDLPLLWLLRDVQKLKGTKYGCGRGLCGACTVHLDGEAVRSCQVPASGLEGREVTTIEGLSARGDHPLQKAWVKWQVPQCGYCQSGQIMSAAALLARHRSPTRDQIDAAMSGNLCRCGTYVRILGAIREVAKGQ